MGSYTTADARRDLNPHKAAVAAMWLFGERYAKLGLGSMGFWDRLTPDEKRLCQRMVQEIEKAAPER